MPQGLGDDVGQPTPGDRVVAGVDDADPTPPEQSGSEDGLDSEADGRGGSTGSDRPGPSQRSRLR